MRQQWLLGSAAAVLAVTGSVSLGLHNPSSGPAPYRPVVAHSAPAPTPLANLSQPVGQAGASTAAKAAPDAGAAPRPLGGADTATVAAPAAMLTPPACDASLPITVLDVEGCAKDPAGGVVAAITQKAAALPR